MIDELGHVSWLEWLFLNELRFDGRLFFQNHFMDAACSRIWDEARVE